jgi:uncharacterized protein
MKSADSLCRSHWCCAVLLVLVSGCAALPVPVNRAPPSALPSSPQTAPRSPLYGAESAFERGDLAMARAHLDALADHSVPVAEMPRLQLLRARLAAAEGRDQDVLRHLPASVSDPVVGASAAALRAEALQRLDQPVEAVAAWVERLQWLQDPIAIDDNRDRLWQGLMASPLTERDRVMAAGSGFVVEGWVALALAHRQADGGVAMERWQQQFGPHPASAWMTAGGLASAISAGAGGTPFQFSPVTGAAHWAVLLPFSGPLATSAAAIRDGWLAAYLEAGVSVPVRFYDTGGHAEGARQAYQAALQEGATLLIGPLHKDSVAAVLANGRPPVPMMALNQLDGSLFSAPVSNVVQFALAPEDEARAAARQAIGQQLFRAVMLLPEGAWGDRIALAFEQALSEAGGAVIERRRYAPGTADFSEPIKDLMRVTDSEARYRELVNVLGSRPVFETRRRGDIDLVFFAGRPVDGRQIWSQFRFHRAQDLPAFATALIYDPQQGVTGDLIGTRFCDQPWVVDPQRAPSVVGAAAELANLRDQPRLFAMGVDALMLARELSQGGTLSAVEGMTGVLSVMPDGRVQRTLACARITSRGLEPLPAPAAAPWAWSDGVGR